MREGWVKSTLGESAEFINGYPFKPGELGHEGLPVIRIKQLLDPIEPVDRSSVVVPERCVLNDGDLVFSWSATLAVRIWDRGAALLNQHLFRVVEREGVDRRWLALALDHAIEELESKSHGTTMKHITKATLLPHSILLPPLAEQRRIVDLIGAVDDALAVNSSARIAVGDSLAAFASSLYENAPGRRKIIDECELLVGFAFKSTTFTEDETCIRLLRGDNITPSGLRWEGVQRLNGEMDNDLEKYQLEAGDLVLAMDRPVISGGVKVSRVNDVDVPSLLVQRVARLRPRDPNLTPLLYGLLSATPFRNYLETVQTGGHAPHISAGLIRDFDIPALDVETARTSSDLLGALSEVGSALVHEHECLLGLRRALLSELLSGTHEIPDSYDELLEAS